MIYRTLAFLLIAATAFGMERGAGTDAAKGDSLKVNYPHVSAKADTAKKDSTGVWVPTMVTGLNISQIAFSNWTQGGTNSIAWTLTGNVGYDYTGKTWGLQNRLKAAYGRTRLGGQGTITTDNELFLENVLTYNLGWATDPFFSNTVITDVTAGYSYSGPAPVQIADFFDPGYVTQSIGFSYAKLKFMKTRLGVAAQEIFANRFRQYTDGVHSYVIQAGLESVTRAKLQIANNVLMTTGLRLFTRFNSLDVWDVRWDNVIAAKVNSFVNVNFNYQLVYQKDQSLRTQMKEGLQLGVVYTIF